MSLITENNILEKTVNRIDFLEEKIYLLKFSIAFLLISFCIIVIYKKWGK